MPVHFERATATGENLALSQPNDGVTSSLTHSVRQSVMNNRMRRAGPAVAVINMVEKILVIAGKN